MIEEQCQKIWMARARLQAEVDVAKALLPEDCQSEMHYNGAERASEKYPQYRKLIRTMKGLPT